MIVAEKLIDPQLKNMETYFVYTDGNTWYDKACNVRRLKHYLHSSLEKSSNGKSQPTSI